MTSKDKILALVAAEKEGLQAKADEYLAIAKKANEDRLGQLVSKRAEKEASLTALKLEIIEKIQHL